MASKNHDKKQRVARLASKRRNPKDGGMRETVEGVAIAFALAFLFKTFQAEAYVIPTGSMAPTLHGRHKEVTCPSCRLAFQVGASTELDDDSGYIISEQRIEGTLCPNCRRPINAEDAPAFNGDRIIVNKEVAEYKRFDVVVFKNPEEGHVNYIKRLVGLPGEIIRIRQGNLWMRMSDEDRWQMLRKDDPQTQKDIQLLVYDDRHPPTDLIAAGWPERWVPSTPGAEDPDAVGGWLETANSWQPNRESRQYSISADGDSWQWLRYRHFVPSPTDWDEVDNGQLMNVPQASLVSDYCGFNVAATPRHNSFESDSYWVGDLTLNCHLDVTSVQDGSTVRLELVEGLDNYSCTFQLTNGTVEISRVNHRTDRNGERPETLATAAGGISGVGAHDVSFANVDNRLLLWIDGSLVEFDQPIVIDQNFVDALAVQPGQADAAPCGVAAQNVQLVVSDLLIQRDIYYRNDAYKFDPQEGYSGSPYDLTARSQEVANPSRLHRQLKDPDSWAEDYAEEADTSHQRFGQYTEYRLNEGEYLMFGDNSPRSKDSRLFDYYNRPRWGMEGHRYAVQEKDLIGKAMYVFWPHGVPFMNDGQGFTVTKHKEVTLRPDGNVRGVETLHNYPQIRFPFYPNFGRMKKIR